MNSFSHALPYLDRPYFAVGCCVPDLLTAFDRKCRARKKKAADWTEDDDPLVRQVARGVVQHHLDDDWFHRGPSFQRLNQTLAVECRQRFPNDHSMRPSLIGHVVIEMLLDAYLARKFVGSLEDFYRVVGQVDPLEVQAAVNRFANRPTSRLTLAIEKFYELRYIFDYALDSGVRYRMNRVLERIGLAPLPQAAEPWIATARLRVNEHALQLLHSYAKKLPRP